MSTLAGADLSRKKAGPNQRHLFLPMTAEFVGQLVLPLVVLLACLLTSVRGGVPEVSPLPVTGSLGPKLVVGALAGQHRSLALQNLVCSECA